VTALKKFKQRRVQLAVSLRVQDSITAALCGCPSST